MRRGMLGALFLGTLISILGLIVFSRVYVFDLERGKTASQTVALRTISDPKDPSAIVIFVHGFRGDGITTWQRHPSATSWPNIVAGDPVFSRAQVLVYEYFSTCSRGALSPTEIARDMFNVLGDKVKGKHIVLVAHSLGGLGAVKFLQRYLDPLQLGRVSVFFLGTPSEGSDVDWIAKLVCTDEQGSLKLFYRENRNQLIADMIDDWTHVKERVSYKCAYELKPYFGKMVVGRLSAATLCGSAIPIDENHSDLSRPKGDSDRVHEELRNAYRQLSRFDVVDLIPSVRLKLQRAEEAPGKDAAKIIAEAQEELSRGLKEIFNFTRQQHAEIGALRGQVEAMLGREDSGSAALDRFISAIELLETAIPNLPRETSLDARTTAQIYLGIALLQAGDQSKETAFYERAVRVLTEARQPKVESAHDWGTVTALIAQARLFWGRSDNSPAGRERIRQSVREFDSALDVSAMNRRIDTEAWAIAQSYLAEGLRTLADGTVDEKQAIELYERSARASHEALKVFDPDFDQQWWALTKLELALAQFGISARLTESKSVLSQIEEATSNFEQAAKKMDKNLDAESWLVSHAYLVDGLLQQDAMRPDCNVVLAQRAREIAKTVLEDPAAKEDTSWKAVLLSQSGRAKLRLGREEVDGRQTILEAVRELKQASIGIPKDGHSADWVSAHQSLAEALSDHATYDGKNANNLIEYAEFVLRMVLSALPDDHSERPWTTILLGQNRSEWAASKTGKIRQGALVDARQQFERAISKLDKEKDADVWSIAHRSLGEVLRNLGLAENEHEEDVSLLVSAEKALVAARDAVSKDGQPESWALASEELAYTQRLLGERKNGEFAKHLLESAISVANDALNLPAACVHLRTRSGLLYSSGLARAELFSHTSKISDLVQAKYDLMAAIRGWKELSNKEMEKQGVKELERIESDLRQHGEEKTQRPKSVPRATQKKMPQGPKPGSGFPPWVFGK